MEGVMALMDMDKWIDSIPATEELEQINTDETFHG
jgi:hypothetical protein